MTFIVRLTGGLGNQMFQYALARSLAKKYNARLKLDIS
ncbi:alpha-1,2-fucosyltransferase, partial [Escherichia coli]|nr:alpha-1,2-fucosyltransferase [Escherichia coli]